MEVGRDTKSHAHAKLTHSGAYQPNPVFLSSVIICQGPSIKWEATYASVWRGTNSIQLLELACISVRSYNHSPKHSDIAHPLRSAHASIPTSGTLLTKYVRLTAYAIIKPSNPNLYSSIQLSNANVSMGRLGILSCWSVGVPLFLNVWWMISASVWRDTVGIRSVGFVK